MPFIQEHGLSECINNSYWLELVNLRVLGLFEYNEVCRNCEISFRCGSGCRAEAMSYEPDSYFGKSPIVCELYKGGWPEKIIAEMKTIKLKAECIKFKQK